MAAQRDGIYAHADHFPAYHPGMYPNYPGAWRFPATTAGALYAGTAFAALASSMNMAAQPVPYDYGSNVVVQPTNVYVNGDSTGTPEQYSQQASQIAGAGAAQPPDADDKWMPLGVFALVEGNETTSDDVFQLAVNPQGIIRGNYHNVKADTMDPISGSIDKKTQRAAWTIGKDKTPVYEAGVVNLTKDVAPLLVHTDNGDNQVSLVRLPQPAAQ